MYNFRNPPVVKLCLKKNAKLVKILRRINSIHAVDIKYVTRSKKELKFIFVVKEKAEGERVMVMVPNVS